MGTDKPASIAEQIEFAQFCTVKKYHAAAARFYRDTFTADPKRAEDLSSGTRYDGACAAALAACGSGKAADKLDDKERATWRSRARDWLGLDLQGWAKIIEKGDA